MKRFKEPKEALREMTNDLIGLMAAKESKPFNLALSGGETAKQMFSLWVDEYRERIDWSSLHFFWVDERCVPPTSPDSNYGNAYELLFKPLGIPEQQIHRIEGETNKPQIEAVCYSEAMWRLLPLRGDSPAFDCIILGVGEDAHTASIFPYNSDLLWDRGNYALSRHPTSRQLRITMTGRLLLNEVPLLVPILGANKEPVIAKLAKGYSFSIDMPAIYVLSNALHATVYALTAKE